MALTGSNSEPMSRPGFSDGTMEESDGSVSEPCFVFDDRHARASHSLQEFPKCGENGLLRSIVS